jgi:hypothetical protein
VVAQAPTPPEKNLNWTFTS